MNAILRWALITTRWRRFTLFVSAENCSSTLANAFSLIFLLNCGAFNARVAPASDVSARENDTPGPKRIML